MIRPIADYSKTLSQVGNFLGIEGQVGREGEVSFSGITANSKQVNQGDLFIALPGAKFHGASFIDDVKELGAVAVLTDEAGALIVAGKLPTVTSSNLRTSIGPLCSWFYGSPTSNIDLIGITGTNGKTTTASLLNQILRYAGKQTGLIGTVGIEIGQDLLPTTHTTPEAPDLQSLFATMRERHIGNVVMEVSSHGIEVGRIAGCRFTMVGFSNLTQDHLDFHGSMENYFESKKKLFTSEYSDLGFINIDDPNGEKLFTSGTIPMISISRTNRKAQWHYQGATQTPSGYQVSIRGTGGILIEGELNLIGEHNLDNVLMAVAMASQSEIDPLVIGNSLSKLLGAPGRLEKIELKQNFLALVDYAHTPDAVERTLATLRKTVSGKIIAVLGCGGDRDKSKRPLMGNALVNGSDISVFTSDNPRSEDPARILHDMTEGLNLSQTENVILDRREAIAFAVACAQLGDCVILLGKGHETGQEVNGKKFPFDDRLELARAIEELA